MEEGQQRRTTQARNTGNERTSDGAAETRGRRPTQHQTSGIATELHTQVPTAQRELHYDPRLLQEALEQTTLAHTGERRLHEEIFPSEEEEDLLPVNSDVEMQHQFAEDANDDTQQQQEEDAEFTTVHYKRQHRTDAADQHNPRKRRADENIETSNRYAPIAPEADAPQGTTSQDAHQTPQPQAPTNSAPPKPPAIPPVTIANTKNYLELNRALQAQLEGNLKAVYQRDRIKYHFESFTDQRKAIAFFSHHQIDYFTHQSPEDKELKVVIKRIPESVPADEVMGALREKGFHVINVHQYKKRDEETNELIPQPSYCVRLPKGRDSHKIYDLQYLLYTRVRVETYRSLEGPVQCKHCQRFEHTANYCSMPVRCVRCGGHHTHTNCPLPRTEQPKCCNCGKNHPASYRGCEVYQTLLKKYRPKPARRQTQRRTVTFRNRSTEEAVDTTQKPTIQLPPPPPPPAATTNQSVSRERRQELRQQLRSRTFAEAVSTLPPTTGPRTPITPAIANIGHVLTSLYQKLSTILSLVEDLIKAFAAP